MPVTKYSISGIKNGNLLPFFFIFLLLLKRRNTQISEQRSVMKPQRITLPLDLDEQVILMKKYVSFTDDTAIRRRLSYTGFFRLRRYGMFLLSKMGRFGKKPPEQMLYDLYDFDERLRLILFAYCKKAEIQLKTNMTVGLSNKENSHLFYLHEKSYTPTKGNNDKISKQNNMRFFDGFIKDIRNNERRIRTDSARYPEIKEMRPKGKGENDLLPAEVYFYYIDLGDICPIYSYLRGDLRKEVLKYGYTRKNYGKETTKQFDTWLEATRNLRNYCAHHLMLSGKTSCVILPEFGEDYLVPSKTDLFSRLYALKKILPEHFSDALKKDLKRLIENADIDVFGLGILPRDWEEKFERIRIL